MTIQPWQRVEPTETHTVAKRTITIKRFELDGKDKGLWGTFLPENTQMVATIALTTDDKVVVVRQFRPGPEKIMVELPGGFVDKDEPLEVAARRELREETGYEPEAMVFLGSDYKDAYTNGTWNYFLGTGCKLTAPQHLDPYEELEVDTISISQLIANANHGKMTDATAVLLAYEKLMEMLKKENA